MVSDQMVFEPALSTVAGEARLQTLSLCMAWQLNLAVKQGSVWYP